MSDSPTDVVWVGNLARCELANVHRSNYARATGGNDGQPRVQSLLMNRQIARNLLCLLRSSVCLLICFVLNCFEYYFESAEKPQFAT